VLFQLKTLQTKTTVSQPSSGDFVTVFDR